MNYTELGDRGCYVFGSDPGPESSALALVYVKAGVPRLLIDALYAENRVLAGWRDPLNYFEQRHHGLLLATTPKFFCYESCGPQGKFVDGGTFETAAMGGELRRLFRGHVDATYAFDPSDWRHILTGRGNAGTRPIYEAACALFGSGEGGGADKYKGTKKQPGQLARLHAAGAGGNMEHMKDALGVALALTRCQFRRGEPPERYRRPW